jgi:ribosomal-protein-alanine N-acetyltransferase
MRTVLETPRLVLREFADDFRDLAALNEIQSDPDHMRFYPHPFSVDESRNWIARMLREYEERGFGLWVVEDRETGEFLGSVGPMLQTVDDDQEIELGWSVTPRRAREGIASEAAAACRDYCFDVLGLDHLIALVRPENTPSRGVAERIGMAVWKEVDHGSERWRHLVDRVDAQSEPRATLGDNGEV